jgi:TolB-like protein
MSPEQARGQPVDCRTDLFSLGAVLYEMLAGIPAMQGATASDIIASILTRDPEPLATRRPDCPHALIDVISRALQKDREDRYSSVAEMIADLRSVTSAPVKSGKASRLNALRLHAKAVTVAVASATLAIVFLLFLRSPPDALIDSVAVLPMLNEGGQNLQFVADGLTDSLIGDLSEIPKLKVTSRAAAFLFWRQRIDPVKAGKLLNSRMVLTGGVSQEADRFLLHLELVEAKTNRRIWSEHYTTIWNDLLAVEGAISREVVGKLRVPLTRNTKEELQKRHDVRPEAYRLYLRGQSALYGPTQADLEAAVLYLHRALENDSSYAPAAVGLANAYVSLTDYLSPREAMPKAREYALKAIEAGGASSGAHAALGLVKLLYDWDWRGAAQELRWDTPLNPHAVEAFSCYLHYRDAVFRTSETEATIAILLARDPLSAWMNHEMGCASYYARHYQKAIEQFSRTVKISPDFQIAYMNAGRTFVQQQKYQDAISTLEAGRKIDPNWPLMLAELAYAHAAAGHRVIARRILTELEGIAKRRYVDAVPIALVYLRIGDRDTAFSYLEKAYIDRSSSIPWLRAEPRFDPVRSDPRYLRLLKRVGLAE